MKDNPKVGELYRFNNESRRRFIGDGWCRHGLVTIAEGGIGLIGIDTYWRDRSDGLTRNWWPWEEIKDHVDFVIDLGESKEVHREMFDTYEDKDRAWIPQGGSRECFYVSKSANPSIKLQIEQIKTAIRHSKERIQTEIWNVERKEKELIQLGTEIIAAHGN